MLLQYFKYFINSVTLFGASKIGTMVYVIIGWLTLPGSTGNVPGLTLKAHVLGNSQSHADGDHWPSYVIREGWEINGMIRANDQFWSKTPMLFVKLSQHLSLSVSLSIKCRSLYSTQAKKCKFHARSTLWKIFPRVGSQHFRVFKAEKTLYSQKTQVRV